MNPRRRRILVLWGPALAFMVLIFALSHIRLGTPRLRPITGADKVVHALEYAVLTVLLWRALKHSSVPRLCHWSPLVGMVIASAYGVTDEWHQSFVGRDSDVLDWLADTIGAGLTAAVLMGWQHSRADPRANYPPEKW